MKFLFAAACAVMLSTPAFALKPATEQFLTELGFTPQSAEITTIAGDVVNGKSLDTLAAKRDESGVRAFIATRGFIRAFKQDANAAFPDDDLYNIGYLTAPEKLFIATKLAEGFPPRSTIKAA